MWLMCNLVWANSNNTSKINKLLPDVGLLSDDGNDNWLIEE